MARTVHLWTGIPIRRLRESLGSILTSLELQNTVVPVEEEPFPEPEDLILTVGDEVIRHALEPRKLTVKGRTINSLRFPNVFQFKGVPGLITFSPESREIDYGKYVNFFFDMKLAARYLRTGSFEPKLGKYRYVTDLSEAVAVLKFMAGKSDAPIDVALDLETVGLDYLSETGWILTIQVSTSPGQSDVVYFATKEELQQALQGPLRDQLRYLLTSQQLSLRGANLKYDLLWLYQYTGIECTNFKFDTMLVGSLLDENRGNSLNVHTKWYVPELGGYDDQFNKDHDKSRMDLVPKDELLDYAGGDTDACLTVSKHMKKEILSQPRLASFYVNILHPAARAYEKVERTGILVDTDYMQELESEINQTLSDLEEKAKEMLNGRLLAKHLGRSKKAEFKILNPTLLRDFFFGPLGLNLKPKMLTPKTNEPVTGMDHIELFADHPDAAPMVSLLKEYSSAQKTLTTYVVGRKADGTIKSGFLKHLRSDGRYHPTYFLFNGGEGDGGTNTGRLSARDPAIQTVPKHTFWAKKIRRAMIAPDGYLIMSNDYSQGELKIAACLANEENMIRAYLEGLDLHAVTAASVGGWEWEEFMALKTKDSHAFDEMRQLGKAGNFGLLYGMGVEGFMAYAENTYGVILTAAEAEAARNKFFMTYPGLSTWHRTTRRIVRATGQVVSPLGRVRHLPMVSSPVASISGKAERQAINAPVQSTLSDLSLWATAEFDRRGWLEEAPVIAMIHDQLISYVPEDRWEEVARRNKEVMENLPFEKVGWEPQLKFTVDCEIGCNLGEMKKVAL